MNKRILQKKGAEIISTWFWVGKIRWAPGTWGTLATVPFVYALSLAGPINYMIVTIVFLFIGIGRRESISDQRGQRGPAFFDLGRTLGEQLASDGKVSSAIIKLEVLPVAKLNFSPLRPRQDPTSE